MDDATAPEGLPHFTPFEMGAMSMYELFRSYVKAGFNERQALILIAEMVAAHNRGKE